MTKDVLNDHHEHRGRVEAELKKMEMLQEEIKQASSLAQGVHQTLQEHRQTLVDNTPEEVVKRHLGGNYEVHLEMRDQLDRLSEEVRQNVAFTQGMHKTLQAQ